MPDFCSSCWWLKYRIRNKVPFSGFPGIFTVMDSFIKRRTHGWFDRNGAEPPWLAPIGPFTEYLDVPKAFGFTDQKTGVHLYGVPDDLFRTKRNDSVIVDYKLSRYKGPHDYMGPIYHTQVNGYAMIANALGLGPVTWTGLVYTTPQTSDADADDEDDQDENGFAIKFKVELVEIPIEPKKIAPLLEIADVLGKAKKKPAYSDGCKNCKRINSMVELLSCLPPSDKRDLATAELLLETLFPNDDYLDMVCYFLNEIFQ